MNTPLAWHPKLHVYPYDQQGLILISEATSLWLSNQDFPGITLIDGQRTACDISQHLSQSSGDAQQGALFFYRLEQLKQSGLLCPDDLSKLPKYCYSSATHPNISWQQQQKIVNLSHLPLPWVEDWINALVSVLNKTQHRFAQPLTLILVDDFFDPRLLNLISGEPQCWVIKVSGEQIWLSPLLDQATVNTKQLWKQLQRQLWENQPVRQLVKQLFPQSNQLIPFQIELPLSQQNWHQIEQMLNTVIDADQQRLTLLNLATSQLSDHPINDYFDHSRTFAEQVNAPVVLQQCWSVFDHDGGSRSVTPQQTLARLSQLISPVTGVITHLEEHQGSLNHNIKIYRTGFFKTPALGVGQAINNNQFVQTCLGKGVSHEQSKVSALCEAIERYSAHYRGDEPAIFAKSSTLSQPWLGYQQLVPYSTTQYRQFADPHHPDSQLKQAALPYDDNEIPWLPTWSLSQQQQVLVPLSLCFSNIPFGAERFGRWHSNGCAAGNTLEEAILQALFELIERDATAIWWYNQVVRSAFDLSNIPADNLSKLAATLDQTHTYWVLEISTDIGIPAMVAVGQDRKTGGYIMGLGCHLLPALAAQRALTELCQLIPIRDQNGAAFDFDAIVAAAFLHPGPAQPTNYAIIDHPQDIKTAIAVITARLKSLQLDTLVLNYSRAHLPIKTAKVFVPGLCHIWPQLANERLYQVPVTMGWQQTAKTDSQLNPQALYI